MTQRHAARHHRFGAGNAPATAAAAWRPGEVQLREAHVRRGADGPR